MQQILCTYSLLLIMAIEAIVVRTWLQAHDWPTPLGRTDASCAQSAS